MYIDIIISDNVFLKPAPIDLRIKGSFHSTEIAVYFKDRIGKETLMLLVQNICSLIEIEFKGYECLLPEDKDKRELFYFNQKSIESLKILVNSLIKVTDVILHQKYTYYEKHTMYMKLFYEFSKIFCGVSTYIENGNNTTDSKTLVKICIRGLKNLMNHFGTIRENTQTLIHSLKCFSQEEIAKFSRIFNYSLRLFSSGVFTTDEIIIFEDLFSIFIYLEEPNFYAIISTNLNVMMLQTEKNKILFSIWRFYLEFKSIAPTLFMSILGYFISNDTKKFGEEFTKRAFDHLFCVIQKFSHEIDNNFSMKIEQFVQFLVVTDESYFYKFEILKSLFGHMEKARTNLNATFRSLTNKLDWILRTILQLFRYYQETTI
ncbi:MAG: hypothetical protein ACRDDF_11640, partial [Aeromonas sp.]